MGFVDTHVHLHFPEYDQDRKEVIERSRTTGVDQFINVGTDVESSRVSLELAQKYGFIWATAGIHPHDVKDADAAALQRIEELLAHPRMVAVGEVGLDFFRDHSPREKQKEIFREFIRIHLKVRKPLVIHCRDAYEDLILLLEEEMKPPYHGVMHCYSSGLETMKHLVDKGLHISFAGPLTYKKNDALREACKACPKDRLLFETDAPFLPPQSMRGKRNESAFLIETAQAAADLHHMPIQELAEITTANAKALFGLC
ncbi:MAG TPA: TatD family hydrolase [bacterium]|nr:TatD family hydrolase [bacterium]